MSELQKSVLERLTSRDKQERCWAATFAGSIEENEAAEVAKALLEVLQQDHSLGADSVETLTLSRAMTSLATILLRLPNSEQLQIRERAVQLITSFEKAEDSEIRHHAKYALSLLRQPNKG